MIRKRINNDFDIIARPKRNGEVVDMSQYEITNIVLRNMAGATSVPDYELVEGNLKIHVTPTLAPILGHYTLVVSFRKEDASLADGYWDFEIDKVVFKIVETTEEESGGDAVVDMDIALGFSGKSAFAIWSETHDGTLADYEAWLRQPATEAATSVLQIEEKIEEISLKRSLRIEKWHTPGYDTYRERQQNYNHTLALKIFHDTEDVTDTINIAQFKWMRISENTEGDPTWNDIHANAGHSIDITMDDLAGDTSFIVQFYDVETQQRLTERF